MPDGTTQSLMGLVPTVLGAGIVIKTTHLMLDDKKSKKARSMSLLDRVK